MLKGTEWDVTLTLNWWNEADESTCSIELDYTWNEQSAYVSGYYSKKYDDRLQSLWLENYPQPILLRWPPLYLTMQCLKACWALPKLCTMRQSVYTRGHVAATHPWDMYPQHFHFCPNVAILSLLDVPTTRPCYLSPLHVPAACPFYTSLLHVLPACPF